MALPIINIVDVEALHQALATQGRYVGKQDQRIKELMEQLFCLSTSVAQTTAQAASSAHSPTITKPEKYDGEASRCRGFLLQCKLYPASMQAASVQAGESK